MEVIIYNDKIRVSGNSFDLLLYDHKIKEENGMLHITGKEIQDKYTSQIITDVAVLEKALPNYISSKPVSLFNRHRIKCIRPYWYKVYSNELVSIK